MNLVLDLTTLTEAAMANPPALHHEKSMTKVCLNPLSHIAAHSSTDQTLPSFGSRSDLELLFANLQNQAPQEVDEHVASSISMGEYAGANRQPSEEPGNVSRGCKSMDIIREMD